MPDNHNYTTVSSDVCPRLALYGSNNITKQYTVITQWQSVVSLWPFTYHHFYCYSLLFFECQQFPLFSILPVPFNEFIECSFFFLSFLRKFIDHPSFSINLLIITLICFYKFNDHPSDMFLWICWPPRLLDKMPIPIDDYLPQLLAQ